MRCVDRFCRRRHSARGRLCSERAAASRAGRLAARQAGLSLVARTPWNEIVLDAHGNAYINCLGFDFPDGEFAAGLIALVTPDGTVRQVADGVAVPNGMAITDDAETLIGAESYGERLTRRRKQRLIAAPRWHAKAGPYPRGASRDRPAPSPLTWSAARRTRSPSLWVKVPSITQPSSASIGISWARSFSADVSIQAGHGPSREVRGFYALVWGAGAVTLRLGC